MTLFEIMGNVVKNHNENADNITKRYVEAHQVNIIEKIDIISVAYPEVARHLERLNNSNNEQDQNTAEDIANCICELLNNKEE